MKHSNNFLVKPPCGTPLLPKQISWHFYNGDIWSRKWPNSDVHGICWYKIISLSLSFYMYIQKCWCEFKTTNILRIYYVCEKICVNWSVNPPKVDRYRKCATIPDPGALHCTPINALHSTHGSSNQWWLRKRCTCVNLYRKLYHFKAFVHIWSSRQNWDLFKLYQLTRAQRTLVNHMTYQPCSGYGTYIRW